jgi:hypothetical protein
MIHSLFSDTLRVIAVSRFHVFTFSRLQSRGAVVDAARGAHAAAVEPPVGGGAAAAVSNPTALCSPLCQSFNEVEIEK